MMLLYLHGFASGPSSRKARFFAERLPGLVVPDLNAGDFEHLTITRQLAVIEAAAAGRAVSLIGSSMGGFLASLYASRHPEVERLVLLAPAFGFLKRWTNTLGSDRFSEWRRTGRLRVYHYGEQRERDLSFDMVEDGQRYPDAPEFGQPALIFHGRNDTVVPPQASIDFAAAHSNARLALLDSDHELTDALEGIWPPTRDFLASG